MIRNLHRDGRGLGAAGALLGLAILVALPAACNNRSSKKRSKGGLAPTITTISPPAGALAGGDAVQVRTLNFTDDFTVNLPVVLFDGVMATVTGAGAANVVGVITPPGAACAFVDVEVQATSVPESATASGAFRYGPVTPVNCSISSICPDQGSPMGGDVITILGATFEDLPRVFFGGIESPGVTWVSDTELQAETPPVVVGGGMVDVRVENPCGGQCTLPASFLYRTVDPAIDLHEPNDTSATCTSTPPLPSILIATIHGNTDEDFFCFGRFDPTPIDVTFPSASPGLNLDIELYDSTTGTMIDSAYGPDTINDWVTTPGAGTYYVRVFGPCGQAGDYELQIP